MPALNPEQRRLRAQIAAHEMWANCDDPAAQTAPARRAFPDRFEREVDPDGTLLPTSAPTAPSTPVKPTSSVSL